MQTGHKRSFISYVCAHAKSHPQHAPPYSHRRFISAGHAEEGGQGAFVFCMQVCCVRACGFVCVCVCLCVYVVCYVRLCTCVCLCVPAHVPIRAFVCVYEYIARADPEIQIMLCHCNRKRGGIFLKRTQLYLCIKSLTHTLATTHRAVVDILVKKTGPAKRRKESMVCVHVVHGLCMYTRFYARTHTRIHTDKHTTYTHMHIHVCAHTTWVASSHPCEKIIKFAEPVRLEWGTPGRYKSDGNLAAARQNWNAFPPGTKAECLSSAENLSPVCSDRSCFVFEDRYSHNTLYICSSRHS